MTSSYLGDLANTGNTLVRANLIGDRKMNKANPAEWIDRSAFAIPAPFTFGDLGRNSLRSDWFRTLIPLSFEDFCSAKRLRSNSGLRLSTPSTTKYSPPQATSSTVQVLALPQSLAPTLPSLGARRIEA